MTRWIYLALGMSLLFVPIWMTGTMIGRLYDSSPEWRVGWGQSEGSFALPEGGTLFVVPIEEFAIMCGQ